MINKDDEVTILTPEVAAVVGRVATVTELATGNKPYWELTNTLTLKTYVVSGPILMQINP